MKLVKYRNVATVVTGVLLWTGSAFGAIAQKGVRVDDGFAGMVSHAVTAVVNVVCKGATGFGDESSRQPEATRQRREPILGSGVIITPDGYILTSYHVIEHSSDIKVILWDDRDLNAKVMGIDPKTDVAVLKVDAIDLPSLTLGNSSSVRVGDVALAIGDPFGLRQTVTMGIISAVGRSGLGILDYEDFIQTDAALNPGSSGGALINQRGELIGIITAGLKEYMGIGFAVPVDLVHSVMNEIFKHGRVIRGWLGVTVQPLTPATAQAFGVAGELRGALIANVSTDGPANHAGLLAGDVIRELDGKPLRDDRDLNFMIGMKAPGTIVRLTAIREGRDAEFTVNLIEEPLTESNLERNRTVHISGPLGLSIQTVTNEISQALDLAPQTRGVIVTDVESSGRAAAAVKEGDIIVEINRSTVTNAEDFYAAVRTSQVQPVLLLIERAGTRMFVVVE